MFRKIEYLVLSVKFIINCYEYINTLIFKRVTNVDISIVLLTRCEYTVNYYYNM